MQHDFFIFNMHPDWQTQINMYCEDFSSQEPAYLQQVVRYTWLNTINPRQLSGHLQGRFLSMLSKLIQPECVLEIGTFTGYSALCLAEGLKTNGKLHTIEGDAETAFKARELIGQTPLADRIEVHTGNAAELIGSLQINPGLIFIDAAKQEYISYFNLCLPILQSGGLMLFDNTLWSQKVINSELREMDADTAAMHGFNSFVAGQAEVEVVMMPLRDGLTMVRKR